MDEYLAKIRKTLVPFRYYSKGSDVPARVADKLSKSGDTGNRAFFELFADLLFLIDGADEELRGVLRALPGLEDVLTAAIEIANCPLDFKKKMLDALEDFAAALEAELRADVEHSNFFEGRAEKNKNIVTHFLSEARRDYLPEFELRKSPTSREGSSPASGDFASAKLFLEREQSLGFSEPDIETAICSINAFEENKSVRPEDEIQIIDCISTAFDKLSTRWYKICLIGYRSNRLAVETPATDERKRPSRCVKTAWAINRALQYLPSHVIERLDLRVQLPPGAIADALRLCYSSQHLKRTSVNQIRRIAYAVLQGSKYEWGDRSNKEGKDSSPQKEKTDTGPSTDLIAEIDVWTEEIEIQKEEGGAPEELDIPIDAPTAENSPEGSSGEAKPFRITYNEPSWSRTNLTDETLGAVWAWMITQAKIYPLNISIQSALLFIEMLLHFGFPPEHLLAAPLTAENDNGQIPAVLRIDAKNLAISPVRSGGNRAFAAPLTTRQPHYLPAEQNLSLPLPMLVSARLNSLRDQWDKDETKFFYELFGEKALSGAKKLVNKILRPLEDILGEKVTVEKISRSVRTLLREQKQLTDLEIALISGEIPQRVASQMFYTNYQVINLQRRYLAGIEKLIQTVVVESRPLVAHLNLDPILYYWKRNYPPPVFPEKSSLRIGSPFVPRTHEFSEYLCGLKTEPKNGFDTVTRFNRLTAYTALALMSLAGLRPLELSNLTVDHLDLNSPRPSIAVTAKINQKHSEWRTLPLAPELMEILRSYQLSAEQMRFNPKLLTEYSRAAIDARIGNSFFFYFRRTLAPVALSTRSLGELLRNPSYLEYLPFLWKLNAPRHLYRTTACELEIPENITDSLMGHQTAGSEALGLFSADNRTDEYPCALKISAEISKLLNLNYD